MKKLGILVLCLAGCTSVEKSHGTWEGGIEAKAKVEPTKPADDKIEVTVSLKRKW